MSPDYGILQKFNVDISLGTKKLTKLWTKYAVISNYRGDWEKMEIDYWTEVTQFLRINITIKELIALSIQIIKPFREIELLIETLILNRFELSICSNQTSFWFERQVQASSLLRSIPRNRMVLSFECGITKDSNPFEMFNLVDKIVQCDRNEVLYIDDRDANVVAANEYGFKAIRFSSHDLNAKNKLEKILLNKLTKTL